MSVWGKVGREGGRHHERIQGIVSFCWHDGENVALKYSPGYCDVSAHLIDHKNYGRAQVIRIKASYTTSEK